MKTAILTIALIAGSANAWEQPPMRVQMIAAEPSSTIIYRDSSYNTIGSSVPNGSGGRNYFDSRYNSIGSSQSNGSGGYNYFDSRYRSIGNSSR